ncbi:MAG TPA: Vps62-related protein, partial [Rhizomicrobium sp.]
MILRTMKLEACVAAAAVLSISIAARAADMVPPVQETLDIIKKYAPLVYLAQGETYLPSSLEDYFQNMHLVCDGVTVQKNIFQVTVSDLPPGEGGPHDNARCRFTTNNAMSGPYDIKPFFHGRMPTAAAPVPVYVYTFNVSNPQTFSVQYNTFYPYNQGKMVCPFLAPYNECLSPFGRREFDDHVADWELMSIRFIAGVPVSIHVGAHSDTEPDEASTYNPI